jgi:hypothetical protein
MAVLSMENPILSMSKESKASEVGPQEHVDAVF